jgi:hypothetical protein
VSDPCDIEVRLDHEGGLDEVLARDAYVHLERMDEGAWWMVAQ